MKERAERNRTITLTEEECGAFTKKCLTIDNLSKDSVPLNSIIYGDMFDVLKKLPSAFVDLLIVDPPYNLSKQYGDSAFKKRNCCAYSEFTERWLNAVKHTLKDNATIYVCCDWKSSLVIGLLLQKNFAVQNRITWQREKGRGALKNWKNSMEDIWFATVSDEFTFNIDDVKMRRKVIAPYRINGKPKDWEETANGNFRNTHPSNFWDDISVPYWSMPENTDHPAQKPEKLIAKLILASSNKGDVMLDPFLGSGTTAVAAKKLERSFVGIECEQEYCALAQKRLEAANKDKTIQGYSGGVFWERNSLAEQQKHSKNRADFANGQIAIEGKH